MPDKLNIVLITTDQQRYDTVHCDGNHLVRPPNLDALARSGCRFIFYYFGLCTYFDDMVGRLTHVLQETKVWRNTLVIFTTDHGES